VAQQVLNLGVAGIPGTGDTAPTFGAKCNSNFSELYAPFTQAPLTIGPGLSGVSLTVNGFANQYTEVISASSTSGQSLGLNVKAGTTSGDVSALLQNQAATVSFMEVFGDGHGFLRPTNATGLSWNLSGAYTLAAPAAGVGMTINGLANQYAEVLSGSSTSGQSLGLNIQSGTTSADTAVLVQNQAGSVSFAQIFGDGHGFLRPAASTGISWTSAGTFNFINGFLGNAATSTLGYAAGAGGAVTQITSRTTSVTLNTITGAITMFNAAGSTTAATFAVSNSTVAATDTIIVNQKSGTNLYELFVTAVGVSSFSITFFTTGGTATDSPVINFSVIKAAAT
jgi:hypothetical protein